MRLIDADKFIKEETIAFEMVQADLADGDGFNEAKRLINEIVHTKIVQLIEEADTVEINDVVDKRTSGNWMQFSRPMPERLFSCSVCGQVIPIEISNNYCPRCGSKMGKELINGDSR